MLQEQAIYKTDRNDLVTSSIYTVAKKGSGGKRRPVINLRWVNAHLPRIKFKMSTMKDVKASITKDCWMTKVDLKDCFWGAPLSAHDQRFLSFRWRAQNYSFRVLPFGLSLSPLYITKLYRHVVERLHTLGHRVIIYIDDMLILGDNKDQCERATAAALALLGDLGAIVNEQKSFTTPSQVAEYLGFIINSQEMTITAPKNKMANMSKALRSTLNKDKVTARQLASVLGKINSLADAMLTARVHTTGLHTLKTCLLKQGWEAAAPLSEAAREDLKWWKDNLVEMNGTSLIPPTVDIRGATDASDYGWGAWLEAPLGPIKWGGLFDPHTAKEHINYKELLAVFYLLQCPAVSLRGKTLELGIDNTTAMWYLKKLGGKNPKLALLAEKIFQILKITKITLTSYHLPGLSNGLADGESRDFRLSDFKLTKSLFTNISQKWGPFSMDLFATFENRQTPRFASFTPQPEASWVDSMKHTWEHEYPWAHPPFSMIGRVLQKVENENSTLVILTPLWPAQPWFPLLLRSMVDLPIILPRKEGLFQHPLSQKGNTPSWVSVAWRISGKCSERNKFRKKLLQLLSRRGPLALIRTMTPFGVDGLTTPSASNKIRALETSIRSMHG